QTHAVEVFDNEGRVLALRDHFESATVRADAAGRITVFTGVPSQGPGLETTLAQVAADELGVTPAEVAVVGGDTLGIPQGIGTFARPRRRRRRQRGRAGARAAREVRSARGTAAGNRGGRGPAAWQGLRISG